MLEKNAKRMKRKTKSRSKAHKQASKKSYSRRLYREKIPLYAAKPRRGPCHTICHLLLAVVGNSIRCHCCRCRAAPPANNSTKPRQTAWTRWLCLGQIPTRITHECYERNAVHLCLQMQSAYTLPYIRKKNRCLWIKQYLHFYIKHKLCISRIRGHEPHRQYKYRIDDNGRIRYFLQ